jgi:hypothetical protein
MLYFRNIKPILQLEIHPKVIPPQQFENSQQFLHQQGFRINSYISKVLLRPRSDKQQFILQQFPSIIDIVLRLYNIHC